MDCYIWNSTDFWHQNWNCMVFASAMSYVTYFIHLEERNGKTFKYDFAFQLTFSVSIRFFRNVKVFKYCKDKKSPQSPHYLSVHIENQTKLSSDWRATVCGEVYFDIANEKHFLQVWFALLFPPLFWVLYFHRVSAKINLLMRLILWFEVYFRAYRNIFTCFIRPTFCLLGMNM